MIRDFSISRLRNIGIMAHIDAGKTTTTERILYYTGMSHKIGEVHDGGAVTDYMEQERERGITITSAAVSASWKPTDVEDGEEHRVNIIDTPGHVDFTVEVQRSLRVLDASIAVFDAVSGVEPQSETVWRQANEYDVPRMIFMNKMDKMGADFETSMLSVRNKLKANAVAAQIPIGAEGDFEGVIDLVRMKEIVWNGEELGARYEVRPIRESLQAKAAESRDSLQSAACEFDDAMMEKYLNGDPLSETELRQCIRKGVLSSKFFPVFCGTAFRNKGVQPLLDAVVHYCPSPLDVPPAHGTLRDDDKVIERKAEKKAPFVALAFKVINDPHVGKLTFIRVYSGFLASGSYAYNTTRDAKERVGRLIQMQADKQNQIPSVEAGDIAAIIGLKNTTTGDTLITDGDNEKIILEAISFPEPVIDVSIEPKTRADQEKLSIALKRLTDEDPTFRVSYNKETGQTVIGGMGELHLEIIVDRLRREHKVDANVGRPQVAYRETIQIPGEAEGKYIKQTGGRGQYGHCKIRVFPNPGKGYVFDNKVVGGSIPKEYVPAIDRGIQKAMLNGVVAGYPVVDVRVEVYDGSYHEVDSNEKAFEAAGSLAYREASKKCKPVLLEPVFRVDAITPEEYMGNVLGDLNSRRAEIQGMDDRSGAKIIRARVPLAEMFGYATTLRTLSQGRANFTMQLDVYKIVPGSISQDIQLRGEAGEKG